MEFDFSNVHCIVYDVDRQFECTFEEVKKLPTPKDFFNFILFFFRDDDGYFSKPYIQECMQSWRHKFSKSRLIYIPVWEAQELSLWSKKTIKRRNYPTDSLRVLFASQLKNCFYLDTDVYLAENLNLPLDKKCFVLDHCSGTMLWNKKPNNKLLLKWFQCYEDIASQIPEASQDVIEEINKKDRFIEKYGDISLPLVFGWLKYWNSKDEPSQRPNLRFLPVTIRSSILTDSLTMVSLSIV